MKLSSICRSKVIYAEVATLWLKRLATLVYNRPVPREASMMLRLLALVGFVQVAAQTVGGGTGGSTGGTVGGSTGVDLSQINRDFHYACSHGDQERATALLAQGTSRLSRFQDVLHCRHTTWYCMTLHLTAQGF